MSSHRHPDLKILLSTPLWWYAFSLKTKTRHLHLCNLLMTLYVLIRPGHCEQSRRAERQCQGRDTGEERVRGDRGGHGAGPAQCGAGQQRGGHQPVGPPRHSL